MASSTRARIAAGTVVLVGLQALAIAIYRSKEEGGADAPAHVVFEMMSGHASDLEIESNDGTRKLWQARGDKPALIHFWASWCTPCRKELPALLELARSQSDRVRVIAISLDSGWEPVRLFFDGSVPEQVVRLAHRDAHRSFNVSTLPDTFVVAPSGALIARSRGPQDWTSPSAVEKVLERGALR